MRWSPAAALFAALLVIAAACGDEPDVAVLGATATRPDVAQFASTTDPSGSSSTPPIAPATSDTARRDLATTSSDSVTVSEPTTTLTVTTPTTTQTAAPPVNEITDLGAAAEALIDYPFRSVLEDWSIRFAPGRDAVRGLTFPQSREIEIYIREGDTAAMIARVLAHEVGHALDVTYNDDADRGTWRTARGIDDSVPWWPEDTTFDFDTISGDWAESFAVIQTGATHQSNVAGALNPQQVDVLIGLLP